MSASPLDVLPGEESSIELEVGRQVATGTCTLDRLPTRTDRQRSRIRPDRDLIDGRSRRHREVDDGILQAVRQIREQESVAPDKRSEARLAFLYPARVTFSDSMQAWQIAGTGEPSAPQQINLDAVMTDLSAEGAGILVSARHEPLPRRISLVVDDILFHCTVRWTKHVGGSVYRYGLVFRAVRAAAPSKSSANDRASDT